MRGSPCSIVSSMRRSAMQQEPFERSVFETVPEPMIVPADSGRVRAAWAIKAGKSKVMSTPALGEPKSSPFLCTTSGKCRRAPSHASPSSSGVTATGEKALEGLLCMNPKPLPSSAGTRPRSETSLTSSNRRM